MAMTMATRKVPTSLTEPNPNGLFAFRPALDVVVVTGVVMGLVLVVETLARSVEGEAVEEVTDNDVTHQLNEVLLFVRWQNCWASCSAVGSSAGQFEEM
jgi:hypothetical protein